MIFIRFPRSEGTRQAFNLNSIPAGVWKMFPSVFFGTLILAVISIGIIHMLNDPGNDRDGA
jgi:hypothetical protein